MAKQPNDGPRLLLAGHPHLGAVRDLGDQLDVQMNVVADDANNEDPM